jgi:hypothetical protein
VSELVGLGTALDLDRYAKEMEQMMDPLKAMQEIMETQIGSIALEIVDGLPRSDTDLSGE